MMKHRIVLVKPLHDSNVGSVCRVMKNFGFTELVIVQPECKLGFDALLYAKHARDVLQKARVVSSFKEAIKGYGVVVGTTGVLDKYSRQMFKNCVSITELSDKIGSRKACIVFGSEGTGLTDEELLECDLVAHIPTSDVYPVMNLSHAVAVTLYSIAAKEKFLYAPADRKKVFYLEELFSSVVDKSKKVKDKKKIKQAFSSILKRSAISDDEIQALFSLFSEIK
ncbi:RNA methyltransferase [Candidatus Micrarchaeota archaeon]|nr:RNA methyltransferase [Candidatus Micrarchaeota archaeon]